MDSPILKPLSLTLQKLSQTSKVRIVVDRGGETKVLITADAIVPTGDPWESCTQVATMANSCPTGMGTFFPGVKSSESSIGSVGMRSKVQAGAPADGSFPISDATEEGEIQPCNTSDPTLHSGGGG